MQARYFGPYTVEKKVSDLIYVINTPGRPKQTQMCHVNMLKEYIDRDSSVTQHVTDVTSRIPEQSVQDLESISNDIFGNFDPGQPKRQNSDILKK